MRSDYRTRPPEGGSVGSNPKHREPADTEFADQSSKFGPSGLQLSGVQLVGPSGGASNDVGDAEAVGEQQVLLCWRKLTRSEPGPVQGRPEPVTRTGEMVAGSGRVQARVDPGEQHAQAGCDQVRDGSVAGRHQVGLRWTVRPAGVTRPGGYGGRRCNSGHTFQATGGWRTMDR